MINGNTTIILCKSFHPLLRCICSFLPQAHFRRVVMFSLVILVDLHPDILHMARVKPLSEIACKTGWGDSFNMKLLLCTDAAASTSCLVQ